ncbi:hypothetical protein [Enterobacter hormaechei]|uniref:hypothetical protein n=1 Tax=Enterobacter hormaechei TaxID=158836 RepID=UPI001D0E5133|nr:hypothetical protein [Enterobacter hormaechei]
MLALTSTIPISELASVLKRRKTSAGCTSLTGAPHAAVEVIRGKKPPTKHRQSGGVGEQDGQTRSWLTTPGFFVNRVLFPYFAGFSSCCATAQTSAKSTK